MKRVLFTIGLLGFIVLIKAQQGNNGFLLSGEVVYQETVKMNIKLEGVDSQLADQIPKERKTKKVLHFTEEEAVFENIPEEDPGEHMPMEGSGMMIQINEPDNKTYIDLKNKKVIEQREFLSRLFLIESDLKPEKWKITGAQRMILDYNCLEAVAQVDEGDVRVWFTPGIAVDAGPGTFSGLPGLVVAAELSGGDRKLEAIELELKPLDKKVLSKPTKGKKVTPDEFQAMVAEKMKEMGVEGDGTWHEGGGAAHTSTVVIRIEE
jgi:GLPGLI family protein